MPGYGWNPAPGPAPAPGTAPGPAPAPGSCEAEELDPGLPGVGVDRAEPLGVVRPKPCGGNNE